MIIDCESCEVRGAACGDCVVGVLLGTPEVPAAGGAAPSGVPSGAPIVHLDAPERRALDVLADQGLVPRLRLVVGPSPAATREPGARESERDAG